MTDSVAGLSEPEVIVLADPERAMAAAAVGIATTLAAAVAAHGAAHFATTGGSSAVGIYRGLATDPLRGEVPWGDVHLWWGDDRFVPRDHPLSNARLVETILLNLASIANLSGEGGSGIDVVDGTEPGVPLPPDHVHPFPTSETIAHSRDAESCAARYAETLGGAGLRHRAGWPVFDLVSLGLGLDGHVLSVFPDSPAFDSEALALGIPAPTHIEPHVPRVTLNPALLDVADGIVVCAFGPAKASVVGRIFGPERDARRLPGQLARRAGATWILDEAAAAEIPPGVAVRRPG